RGRRVSASEAIRVLLFMTSASLVSKNADGVGCGDPLTAEDSGAFLSAKERRAHQGPHVLVMP
ncbi:MAG: hypothetical protein AAB198_05290, partial [Actinomycetota bacterium]